MADIFASTIDSGFQVTHPAHHKISKVRWANTETYSDRELLFVTGGWDSGENNGIALWALDNPQQDQDTPLDERHPRQLAEIRHSGDLTDLAFTRKAEVVVSGTSTGYINTYKITRSDDSTSANIEEISSVLRHQNTSLNRPVACTSLAVQPSFSANPEVVSCGDDGKLVVSRVEDGRTESYDVDAMTVNAISWASQNQIIIVSSSGRMKLFDRRDLRKPTSVVADEKSDGLNCIAVNPSQINRIVTGSATGGVKVWDLKNLSESTSRNYSVHKSPVWEVLFHPIEPEKVLSCSEDGSCCLTDWRHSPEESLHYFSLLGSGDQRNPVRPLRNAYNHLGINTLDYHAQAKVLVAGTDGESLLLDFTI
ncbi:uncharacterized protein VTP21DRAFT_1555 [Calcarisporiella thermophila]|uniref:uncharacterized protein n=1 Tax=Calcarisporiella thermophila TaxID=911321 RepID=UPI00374326E8